MSDAIRETSPMITPDTLRKINQMNKAFYDSYTKKNFGRSDVLGSQYSGTVENFGYEMLLEARKIRMEKPSLKGVFGINSFEYYFDIQYSNMIETYEQQGMIEAVLRKDVFLPNKEYRLRFENCKDVYIPRAEGWGQYNNDPNTFSKVYKDKFIHTTTSPILVITDLEDESVEEVELSLLVDDGFAVDYYFYNEFSTQRHIDSYEDGTLLTNPITNEFAGLSFVWICEDIFRSLPPVNFVGNEPVEGKPILMIGTDGQNISHIYPLIYGEGSLPTQSEEGSWFLKAYSELDGFTPSGSNNSDSKITSLFYTFRNADTEEDTDYEISFSNEYIKISLSDRVTWDIKREDMNSPYYAEISLNEFLGNVETNDETYLSILTEAFTIKFSDDYLFTPYEGLCEDATSGVHVDILSDYSENSVPKLNGTIHSLGEFDGLPSYFKTMKDRTTHRSHVELYTIRDRLNRYTQLPTEKQTAGLIFDSAIPQEELKSILDEQEPAIVHVFDPDTILYVTDEEKVVSNKNILTEVTYDGPGLFGNSTMLASKNKQKFIYHGNGVFSLGSVEFDPEIETGRVYYIGNDPITYENNATAEKKRSPLTLARICDIPTTYEQLMHVEYNSPTYLFDTHYVRTECGFSIDDLEILMNDRRLHIVMTPARHLPGMQWIYESQSQLPDKTKLVNNGYVTYINIHVPNMPIDGTNFSVLAHGTGYEVDDTFYVLVGGRAYDGTVTAVDGSGGVTSIEVDVPEGDTVSIYNIDGTETVLKTNTISSEHGADLEVLLEIPQSIIDAHAVTTYDGEPPEGLISFAYDSYNNIFLYELQSDWTWLRICQVSGLQNVENPYDESDRAIRSFDYAFFEELLSDPYRADINIFTDPDDNITENELVEYAVGIKGETEQTDLSQYITMQNMPNAFYSLICTSDADNGHFNLNTYVLDSPDGYEVTLPRFNLNNTIEYYNPSNRLIISDTETLNPVQPTMFVYMPTHNKRIDNMTFMTDTILVSNAHVMTYKDFCPDMVGSNRKLKANVYYYPEYELRSEYYVAKNNFMMLGRNALITYIRDTFGSEAEPFVYENSDYRYEHDALVDYIMERWPVNEPAYVKDGLKVHGYADDTVIDVTTGLPVGNAPTGAFVPVTSEVIETSVTCGTRKQQSEPLNIFIIEDDEFDGFSNDFRVHDENGVDITSTSVVIWRGNKYIFREEWMRLMKPIIEGYYNSRDGRFYYDAEFHDRIPEDDDLIYCDINTGQYYKWNGFNYVLIVIS